MAEVLIARCSVCTKSTAVHSVVSSYSVHIDARLQGDVSNLQRYLVFKKHISSAAVFILALALASSKTVGRMVCSSRVNSGLKLKSRERDENISLRRRE